MKIKTDVTKGFICFQLFLWTIIMHMYFLEGWVGGSGCGGSRAGHPFLSEHHKL